MSVGSVMIGLQASRGDGRGVKGKEFISPLNIRPGEVEFTRTNGRAWESGMVWFSVLRLSDFDFVDKSTDAGAQSEAFDFAIEEAFRSAARFLDQRPPEIINTIRAAGMTLQIFIEIRMDQDQMELKFPAEFISACGRHQLGVYIISNDY